jgi:hypothetical protein
MGEGFCSLELHRPCDFKEIKEMLICVKNVFGKLGPIVILLVKYMLILMILFQIVGQMIWLITKQRLFFIILLKEP